MPTNLHYLTTKRSLDTGHGGGMGKTSSITQINQEGVTWGWQSICILDAASRVHH